MQKLDNRLLTCSSFVSNNSIAADIGTDHAYLSAYLVEKGISRYVYACDINDGPLQYARATVAAQGLDEKIEVLKSDGLEALENKELTDVIIAGMGGELIARILGDSSLSQSGINLVLQPMTKVTFLRKWLYENGYEIRKEKAAKEDHFLYTIFDVIYSGEKYIPSEYECIRGALSYSDDISKQYLLHEAQKLVVVAEGLKKSGREPERAEMLYNIADRIRTEADL